MSKIVILAAHPNWQLSRVNRVLIKAARATAAELGSSGGSGKLGHNTIEIRDLYHLYPDFLIDVPMEQAAIADADLVIWQHPIQWYSMPALMKLWLDEVLQYGWAYGPEGTRLRGKDLWLVASTGGSTESYSPSDYNRYFFDAFMPPYEQSATLCGMRWLPPLLMHGAHRVSAEDLTVHAKTYTQRLVSYPDWPEMSEIDGCANCVVPIGQRPDNTEPGR